MTSKNLCLIQDLVSLIKFSLLGITRKKAGTLYNSSLLKAVISAFIIQIQKIRKHDVKKGLNTLDKSKIRKNSNTQWHIKWLLINWLKDEVLYV